MFPWWPGRGAAPGRAPHSPSFPSEPLSRIRRLSSWARVRFMVPGRATQGLPCGHHGTGLGHRVHPEGGLRSRPPPAPLPDSKLLGLVRVRAAGSHEGTEWSLRGWPGRCGYCSRVWLSPRAWTHVPGHARVTGEHLVDTRSTSCRAGTASPGLPASVSVSSFLSCICYF